MMTHETAWEKGSTLEILDIVLQYSFVFGYNPNYKSMFNQMTTEVKV